MNKRSGKRIVDLCALTAILMVSVLLCAGLMEASYADTQYVDGSYTSIGTALYGENETYEVPVTIQIKDSKIVNVAYLKDIRSIIVSCDSDINYLMWAMDGHNVSDETYEYHKERYVKHGEEILPRNGKGLKEQIIEKNGLDNVDTVTGATASSKAVIESVGLSLAKAQKGEKDDPEPELPKPDTSPDVIPEDGVYLVKDAESVGIGVNPETFILNVKNGKISAGLGIQKNIKHFPYLYPGTESEALEEGESKWRISTPYDYGGRNPGSYYSDIPLRSLDKPQLMVMFANSSKQWFNRLIMIKKDDIVKIPYGNYKPSEFTANEPESAAPGIVLGCEKVSINDEAITMDLTFSGAEFSKAVVDGKEYSVTVKGKKKVFTVPVNLNCDTPVSLYAENSEAQEYICRAKLDAEKLEKVMEDNPMSVRSYNKKIKAKAVKKKSASYKAVAVKNAQGGLQYTVKTNKKAGKVLKFNKKTGKITIKKGTKKGTYKMTITVKASGNDDYLSASKTVKCVVTVK